MGRSEQPPDLKSKVHFLITLMQGILIISFGWYGLSCWRSNRMVLEFERYGMARWRRLTGALQLLASLGLSAGYFYPMLLFAAAAGLSGMMFFAVLVRWRIRDSLVATLPALIFLGLNLWLAATAWPSGGGLSALRP